MEHRPVFKTFEVAEAGLKEWAMWVFAMAMIVIKGLGMSPSPAAQQTAKSILQADCNDFKGLYRAAALEYHPDKNDSDTTADMALINNVYEQRKAHGCDKSTLRQTKTSTNPDKSDQPKKSDSPKKSDKSKKFKKSEKPKKSKKSKKPKPKKPGRRKTEAKDDGISTGQVLGGICVGGAVGYMAKECHKPMRRERRPHPPSPGRRTRHTYSSDSSDSE